MSVLLLLRLLVVVVAIGGLDEDEELAVVDEDVVVSEWDELEGEAESDWAAWFVIDDEEFDGEVGGDEDDRLLGCVVVRSVDV